ncbi:MAG: hypothetical protein SNH79_02625 [Rikenellaceae bacterium]
MKRIVAAIFATLSMTTTAQAQIVHSHNDSSRLAPFHDAYAYGAEILGIEVAMHNGEIIALSNNEVAAQCPTMEELYLTPIKSSMDAGRNVDLTLLIDAKGNETTLLTLFKLINERYTEIIGEKKIKFIVHSNVPKADVLAKYPDYVMFDSSIHPLYSAEQLNRVALFSEEFGVYSGWNGLEGMSTEDIKRVTAVIKKAHAQGKPIRFIDTPDNVNTWVTLSNMGADVINTEQVLLCCNMFNEVLAKRDDAIALQFPHNKKGSHTSIRSKTVRTRAN